MKTRALLLSLLVLGLFASPVVLAQGTTAVLTGQVVDKEGQPMPGVTVTAMSNKSAMAPAGTVTDAKGRYRLTPLTPSDDYVLTVELPGFAKVEVSPIDLDPGKTTTQNITLVPSSDQLEKITIVAKGDIVDVASTKTATVFNSEFIEGLPIIGRSYQDILTLAPGVTDVDGDGNPNVNGARSTDFQTRVDGVNTTDPASGTFGSNLNLESIAEIEVITTGASAEFSQAQGGFANIITKSGGNDFEGSFKFFFRSDLFDNDGANNSDVFPQNNFGSVDGFQDLRPFLTFGGPIIKDKLWYFTSLQWINQETPINTLSGNIKVTNVGWNNFGKITYQPSPSHRLSLSANWDPREFTGLGLGTGVEPESDFLFEQGGLNLTLGWTYNISPALLLEMRVAQLDSGIKITPVSSAKPNPNCINNGTQCNPFTEDLYTIDQLSARVTGPFYFTQDDERTRDTLRADLSIFVEGFGGTHNLKTGFEFAREGYENTLTANPIRFDALSTGGGFGGGGSDSLTGSISFQESFPSAFGGRGCIPTGSGAQEICQEFDKLKSDKDVFGFYVQDSFKPRPNLTINVGLRLDREDATTAGFTPFDPREEAAEFLDPRHPGDFNQALMELGATICVPVRPECPRCPVKLGCVAYASGRQDELPTAQPRAASERVRAAAVVLRRGGRVLLIQRRDKGLLQGLWEFPWVEGADALPASLPDALRRRHRLDVELEESLGEVRHGILHRRIHVVVHSGRLLQAPSRTAPRGPWRWVAAHESNVPLAASARKILQLLSDRRSPSPGRSARAIP